MVQHREFKLQHSSGTDFSHSRAAVNLVPSDGCWKSISSLESCEGITAGVDDSEGCVVERYRN